MSITPSLVVSQSSGPAPLGVVCDASGTTGTGTSYPFEELHYQWDYGESSVGVWDYDQKPKNKDIGPIAAHVFETPGTYTITLRIWGANGDYAKATQSISVTDPDTVFATTATYVVNKVGDSDFTGKPTGASEQNTDSWATVVGLCAAGKRVLLKRGSTWTHATTPPNINNTGPGILGAYGTGANPIVESSSSTAGIVQLGYSARCENWRIMDVDFKHNTIANAHNAIIWGTYRTKNITVLRGAFTNCDTPFSISPWSRVEWDVHEGTVICGVSVSANSEVATSYIAYTGAIKWLALLGNDLNHDYGSTNHLFRSEWMLNSAITHNKFRTIVTGHFLKINAPLWVDNYLTRWGTAVLPYHNYTEYNYIGANHFIRQNTDNSGPWDLQMGPQNDGYDEKVRHTIVDGNYFYIPAGSSGSPKSLDLTSDYCVFRNNVVICAAKASRAYRMVSVYDTPNIDIPVGLWVYNNSIYYPGDATETFIAVDVDTGVAGVIVRNNVCKCPSITNRAFAYGAGSWTASNNDWRDSPGWYVDPPSLPEHLAVQLGSGCIDAGYASGVPVRADFNGTVRPYSEANDQGAFEYAGSKRTLFRQ